jgi:hypothetical protein
MKVKVSGLRDALKRFDENGKSATNGHWHIARGGYDMCWELYYCRIPVVNAFKDGKDTEIFNLNLTDYEFKKVADVIRDEYPDCIINKAYTNTLFEHIKENGVETPVKFEIEIVKVLEEGMKRLMRVYIDGDEVTDMVARALNRSIDPKTECLIVRGCRMDMALDIQNRLHYAALDIQNRLHYAAERAGYPDMIDEQSYKLYDGNEPDYEDGFEYEDDGRDDI